MFTSTLHFCKGRASFTSDSNELKPSLFQTSNGNVKQVESMVIPWKQNATLIPNPLGLEIQIVHPARDCEG